MFATRTLARAPVAGRLAGSVSTLRVASLSAFTSGSKLAGFFGRASGQSGAPAFQQLGLRMSLCRAFSSQPPISEPTEADLLTAARNYTVENLKKDFPTLVARMEAMFQPAPEAEPRIISPDSVLALLTILHTLTFQQYLVLERTQRPYRYQFIDSDAELYCLCVRKSFSFMPKILQHCKETVCSHFKIPLKDLLAAEKHYLASDKEFSENHNSVLNGFPQTKEEADFHQEDATLNALELMFELTAGLGRDVKSQIADPEIQSAYVSDKMWQKYGIVPQDLCINPELLSPEGKKRLATLQTRYS